MKMLHSQQQAKHDSSQLASDPDNGDPHLPHHHRHRRRRHHRHHRRHHHRRHDDADQPDNDQDGKSGAKCDSNPGNQQIKARRSRGTEYIGEGTDKAYSFLSKEYLRIENKMMMILIKRELRHILGGNR